MRLLQTAKDDDKKPETSQKKPAPGTTPVGGDIPAKNADLEKVVPVGGRPDQGEAGQRGGRERGGQSRHWRRAGWATGTRPIPRSRWASPMRTRWKRAPSSSPIRWSTEYVNRIGQNIVKNSDCKVPFTIKVIDSDEINAFALPGGFFYVNSGLILNADEEAELAGVMAHETAHVCAHHAVREMTRMNYAQLGTIPLIFIGGWTGYGIYEAASIGIPITFMKFSREFESQADYLGVQYMYRAGYDPQAFITFFEKIQALEKRKPGAVAKVFADHPQTPDRILHTQEEIARILPARDEYMVTSSEFDDVKARLARIENKRRLTDTKGVTRPSLRRASTGRITRRRQHRQQFVFRRQAHAASARRSELRGWTFKRNARPTMPAQRLLSGHCCLLAQRLPRACAMRGWAIHWFRRGQRFRRGTWPESSP